MSVPGGSDRGLPSGSVPAPLPRPPLPACVRYAQCASNALPSSAAIWWAECPSI